MRCRAASSLSPLATNLFFIFDEEDGPKLFNKYLIDMGGMETLLKRAVTLRNL